MNLVRGGCGRTERRRFLTPRADFLAAAGRAAGPSPVLAAQSAGCVLGVRPEDLRLGPGPEGQRAGWRSWKRSSLSGPRWVRLRLEAGDLVWMARSRRAGAGR
jgi:hypothetical protein